MVKWGILGCGKIAKKFAQDLNKVSGCQLIAVGSRNKSKAEEFKIENHAQLSFGSYEALASCSEVDVIYIATPHPFHKDNTILCLNHGKHVLCEKPFAMNEAEVLEMIDAARKNNRFLMEAIWTQFFPYMKKLKSSIANGELGTIKMIEADFGFKADFNPESRLFNSQLGGGALLDIGIYPLFLCHSLLGKPQDISAIAKLGETGVDESTTINLKWSDGAMASLSCTILSDTKCVAKIYGTKAYAEIEPRWHESKSMKIMNRNDIIEHYIFEDDYLGYAYEIMSVNQCIENEELENNLLPLQFSLELIQSIDKIRSLIKLHYPPT